MRLEKISQATVQQLLDGELGDRPPAPGWPHDNTAAGLGFVRNGGTSYLILDDDDRIAGECGTKAPPDDVGMVEIGYGLAAPSRGKGLGRQAVAELVDRLASMPDVAVIEAEVHESNTPSRRVVEGLGFDLVEGPVVGFLRYRLRP
jgi:RimJ/RimL family protein N-acetyltransferase